MNMRAAWTASISGTIALSALALALNGQSHWVRAGTLLPEEGYVATERHFGWDVSLLDDWALVAAPPLEEGYSPGAAFLYEGTGASWRLDRELSIPGGMAQDDFGRATALGAGRAWIGAPGEGGGAGAAYLFERTGSDWNLALRFAPSTSGLGAVGAALAIQGERTLVGAPGDDAVHVLERVGGIWQATAVLRSPTDDEEQTFGHALALDDSRAYIGAPEEGAVYVYRSEGEAWLLEARLEPQEEAKDFGTSLALEDTTLVVGAPDDENEGQVFVFERSPSWSEVARFVAPGISPVHEFGTSVSISNGVVASGAPGEDEDFGSLHLYERDATGWHAVEQLAADPQPGEGRFAYRVAVEHGTLLGNIGLNDTGVIAYVGALYVWTSEPVIRRGHAASTPGPGLGFGSSAGRGVGSSDGIHPLEIDAGRGRAGDTFLVLASLSGTDPGATWTGLHLPLNPDPLLFATLGGGAPLGQSLGVLGAGGLAQIELRLPPQLALHTVHVAGVVFDARSGVPEAVSSPLAIGPGDW